MGTTMTVPHPPLTPVTPVTPGIREDPVGWALLSRETGEVVLWQAPNLPAVVSQVAALVTLLAPRGSRARTAAGASAAVASTWWGADELARGVNPLRRALGAGALVAVAVGATVALRRRGRAPAPASPTARASP